MAAKSCPAFVPGGTHASTQDCLPAQRASHRAREPYDTSEQFKDLIPGAYTCTVVVDP